METPWGSYQLDMLVLYMGRKLAQDAANGNMPQQAQQNAPHGQYRDPRGIKPIRKVTLKPDGTW